MALNGTISGTAGIILLIIWVPAEIWRGLRYGYYAKPELQKDPKKLATDSIFSNADDKYTDEGKRDNARRATSVTISAVLTIVAWLIADYLT